MSTSCAASVISFTARVTQSAASSASCASMSADSCKMSGAWGPNRLRRPSRRTLKKLLQARRKIAPSRPCFQSLARKFGPPRTSYPRKRQQVWAAARTGESSNWHSRNCSPDGALSTACCGKTELASAKPRPHILSGRGHETVATAHLLKSQSFDPHRGEDLHDPKISRFVCRSDRARKYRPERDTGKRAALFGRTPARSFPHCARGRPADG